MTEPSLAQTTDVRTDANDRSTNAFAPMWRNLSDSQLLELLVEASRKVEGLVGGGCRLLAFTDLVERVEVNIETWRPWLFQGTATTWVSATPPLRPEAWTGSVTAVRTLDAYTLTWTTLDVATVDFDPRTGQIRWLTTCWPDAAEITYSGGYGVDSAAVPKDLVQATILLAADTWAATNEATVSLPGDLYARTTGLLKAWADAACAPRV